MKKFTIFIMMVAFIVIVCSVSANAAIVDSGMCGENVSWVFDDSGCLTISGTGAMEDYENETDQPWYDYKYPGLNTAIQKLVIEEGITRIGNNAFRYCGQILEVSLPNTLEEIGDYAFYQVSQLPEINFPSSLRIIGKCAFEKCYAFAKIEVPSGVEEIGIGAFSGIGNALKEVTIAGSVKYIEGSAFSNNYELETVTLNEGTEWIGASAFYMCESMKEISIPQSVREIRPRAFQGCDALEKISFLSGVEIGEFAFQVGSSSETPTGCDVYIPNMQVWYDMSFANVSANPLYADGKLYVNDTLLTELTIPATVKNIKPYAFSNCAELKNVTLENGIASIGGSAFGGCDDLEKITIPESVNSIGSDAFAKCSKLTVYGTPFSAAEAYCTINSVPFVGAASEGVISSGTCGDGLVWALDDDGVLTIYGAGEMYDYTFADPAPWNSSKESIKNIKIKFGATSIGGYAFEGCVNIESIVIPESVTSIGRYAFAGCTKLKSATIPKSVTTIQSSAFTNCPNLTIYGYWKSTAETFANQKSIPFVALSDVVVSGECGENIMWELDIDGTLTVSGTGEMGYIGMTDSWYPYREDVKKVIIEPGITSIGESAFQNCINLVDVDMPDSITSIDMWAFVICRSLADIKLSPNVTSIGMHAFGGCDSLVNITIPAAVTNIADDAFDSTGAFVKFEVEEANTAYCSVDGVLFDKAKTTLIKYPSAKEDENYSIPKIVTNIKEGAFWRCEYLQSITISESVTSVPYRSIFGCAKLTDINVAAENNVYCSVDGVLFSKDKKTLVLYPKGKADTEYAIPKGVVNIEKSAFEWCENLESITIPSGVKEIRYQSFVKCTNLEEIRLPASVESIGDSAFAWCEKLSDIYYSGSEADKASISIEEDSDELLSATWHYSCVDPIEYSFAQSVQIGLIEPWFLKANARAYTDENPINIDYSTLIDYGAYFIRASELENVNAAPETLTAEDIINDADSIKCSKKSGTATVDGSYITASYDKGLYTYEMGDSIFVLFYIEDANGIQYLPIRERNMKELLEKRKNDTENFANVLERNVYTAMDKLELDIGAYRAQFAKIEELPKQAAPMLSEYVEKNGAFEDETVKRYTFKNSVQLILVEPWGLKVNSRVFDDANPININYDSVEEFGAIVYYDTEGNVDSMTAEELRTKSDAYVFSSKNGDAAVDGSYITALYNKDIFTYQLDSNAYVMFYIKDENGYHYGDVKVRNAYELAKERAQDTSGNFGEKEKTVYQDMVAMYEAVKAYRDDYFENN